MKEDYEQAYAHTFHKLDKIDQFLERPNLPKFTWKEIDDFNRPTCIKDWINNLKSSKAKLSGPDGFTDEFYPTCTL